MGTQTFSFNKVVFDSDDPDSSETDRLIVYAALRKLATWARVNTRLGSEIAEARTLMKKNISTELVIFNVNDGMVYLQKRDSLEKNSHEPYPDMYCAWGTAHEPFDSVEDTFFRVQKKLGTLFPLAMPVEVFPKRGEYLPEAQDPPRGVYQLRIFVTVLLGGTVNSTGRWFLPKDIPWDKLVPSHRDIILPRALEEYERLLVHDWQWQKMEPKTN